MRGSRASTGIHPFEKRAVARSLRGKYSDCQKAIGGFRPEASARGGNPKPGVSSRRERGLNPGEPRSPYAKHEAWIRAVGEWHFE